MKDLEKEDLKQIIEYYVKKSNEIEMNYLLLQLYNNKVLHELKKSKETIKNQEESKKVFEENVEKLTSLNKSLKLDLQHYKQKLEKNNKKNTATVSKNK
jgi:hypothetical protein